MERTLRVLDEYRRVVGDGEPPPCDQAVPQLNDPAVLHATVFGGTGGGWGLPRGAPAGTARPA